MSNKEEKEGIISYIIDVLIISIAATLFISAIKSIAAIFRRDEDVTSELGKQILADKKERQKVFEARRKGEKEVETEFGTIYFD